MTPEKAIKLIKQCGLNMVGTANTECERLIISALEKQIPKRPVMKANGWDLYTCPNCDKGIINNNDDGKFPYCHLCGQALDWSDAE